MSILLGTICLNYQFFSSREKARLPAGVSAGEGSQVGGREKKRREEKERRALTGVERREETRGKQQTV